MNSQPENQPKFKYRPSAQKKVMDYLALRDHSELELRKKLTQSRYQYSETEINSAIQFAKDGNWLRDEAELAQSFTQILSRKGKGIHYINQQLKDKGLPTTKVDSAAELEKAMNLVTRKFADHQGNLPQNMDHKQKAKVGRFLAARGFDGETVRKVVYEKLRS